MKKKKWMTTEDMVEMLRLEQDTEQQYCRWLGGILRSTHWLEYSSARDEFGDSTNWKDYVWYSKDELLQVYAGALWMREA